MKKQMMIGMVAAAGLMAACGSSGGDEGSRDALAQVGAQIHGNAGGNSGHLSHPNVGIVWSSVEEGANTPRYSTDAAPLPDLTAPIQFEIFDTPGSDVLTDVDADGDGIVDFRWSFGVLFAFEDVNHDGDFAMTETGIATPDRIFGMSFFDYVIYLDRAPTPEIASMMFTDPAGVHQGFNLVRIDPCSFEMELLGDDVALQLFTFDPGSDVPEELPAEVAEQFECTESPFGGPCMIDETSEECQSCLDAAFASCEEPVENCEAWQACYFGE